MRVGDQDFASRAEADARGFSQVRFGSCPTGDVLARRGENLDACCEIHDVDAWRMAACCQSARPHQLAGQNPAHTPMGG